MEAPIDRQIVYVGAIPQDIDLLKAERNTMTAIAMLSQAILGTATMFDGLAVTPNGPPALNVLVGPGSIYEVANLDSTAFGSLAADTTDQIVKQGIVLGNTVLSTPAPGTGGFSINYLIQATYSDVDTDSAVLPYYNSANPASAFAGPANTGISQNTRRAGVCSVTVKAGVAAATGSQTTPAPDAGNVGIAVVTVANGQATVTAPNITALTGSQLTAKLPSIGHGQCRLSVTSTTLLTLAQYGGGRLVINGVSQLIPAAGITAGTGGLAASTLYYAYAQMVGGAMVLNLSTTSHVTGANGIEVKSGDPTQTLVGMIRTDASVHFVDSLTQRFCLNWFNRRGLGGAANVSSVTFTNTGAVAEITTSLRVEFLTWADEDARGSFDGCLNDNTGGQSTSIQASIDGSANGSFNQIYSAVNGAQQAFSASFNGAIAEGYHYATLLGAVSANTGTLNQAYARIAVRG